MDAVIADAARSLAHGDAIAALNCIGLRNDAAALALKGIAMAQLGDLGRAKALMQRAGRSFGTHEKLARARCIVAEAEIALATRDLAWPAHKLAAAADTLDVLGDRDNALHARSLAARRLLLIGRLAEAERALARIDPQTLTPPLRATHELAVAGIAMRRVQGKAARSALARAEAAAQQARIPTLIAEIRQARATLDLPVARKITYGCEQLMTLEEVEALLATDMLIIDACRNILRQQAVILPLVRRPVLFSIVYGLSEAWPRDTPRDALIHRTFGAKYINETHRARLRVEIGRLRQVLRPVARIHATERGFILMPHNKREVVVLAPPTSEAHGNVLALLADGEAWSSSALALALGVSQRTIQRALDALTDSGKVQPVGRARAKRWMASPLPVFATPLLLPTSLLHD
jgi:DNA-binding transcriptional ArsR family regulator